MPGALECTWRAARQLYVGRDPEYAEAVRRVLDVSAGPTLSSDTVAGAGLRDDDVVRIRDIRDSYQHTNVFALVVLSALVMHYEPTRQDTVNPSDEAPRPPGVKLPELPPMQSLKPEVVRLIEELNGFGEDTDKSLIASMYRHFGYWPTYLSLVRTMLVPLGTGGQILALTHSTPLPPRPPAHPPAHLISPSTPPDPPT